MIPIGPAAMSFLAPSLDKRQHYSVRDLYEAVRSTRLPIVMAGRVRSSIIDPIVNETLAYALAWWLAESQVQHCVCKTSKEYKVVVAFRTADDREDLLKKLPSLPGPLADIVEQMSDNGEYRSRRERTLGLLSVSEQKVVYDVRLEPRSRIYINTLLDDIQE